MSDAPRIEEAVNAVLSSLPCSVTLPAGAGKTELIAGTAAEAARRGGTSLVLTHTHAGVDALHRRMKRFGVTTDRVVVRTIDSWSYDLITHFPLLAGMSVPTIPDWSESPEYHVAAARASGTEAVSKMLRLSYTNLFVDEYQDCTVGQHELVLALSESLPTTVLGDPLQSLFTFGQTPPVSWATDVLPHFPAIELDHCPRRWQPGNVDLGKWLIDVRRDLLSGRPVKIQEAPIRWIPKIDDRTFVGACLNALDEDGTIAVLGKFRHDCVSAASKLSGRYSVMEALDVKEPLKFAELVDAGGGPTVADAVIEFAVKCSVGIPSHIVSAKRKRLREGKSFITRNEGLKPTYEAIVDVRDEPSPAHVGMALDLLGKLPGVSIYCREAWDEVSRALSVAVTNEFGVAKALQMARSHGRAVGRRPAARVISRPLLVKGLEFDHVIILDPAAYDAQELYVALTRGSRSVTIISESGTLPAAKMAEFRQARKSSS